MSGVSTKLNPLDQVSEALEQAASYGQPVRGSGFFDRRDEVPLDVS